MKRVGHLYEQIFTKENFEKAVLDARKGKKRKYEVDYKWFERMKASPLDCFGHYTKKTIFDQSSNKRREIMIPRFYPDQVFHHMIVNVVAPVLQKGQYEYSCASIKGRGTLYASMVLRKFLKKNRKKKLYWVKMDIRQFYPSIEHKILMEKLRRKIKDERMLSLIEALIESSGDKGLPLGCFTSQMLANFFFTYFDHFVKEALGLRFYVRYMDDMVFIDTNRRKLLKADETIKSYLSAEYNMVTHEDEHIYRLCNHHPIDFVGYRHYRCHTTIRRRLFRRIRRSYIRENERRFGSYQGYLLHSSSKEVSDIWQTNTTSSSSARLPTYLLHAPYMARMGVTSMF